MSLRSAFASWTRWLVGCTMARVEEPERPWREGERLVVQLPDGHRIWVRVVEVAADGTLRVIPEG